MLESLVVFGYECLGSDDSRILKIPDPVFEPRGPGQIEILFSLLVQYIPVEGGALFSPYRAGFIKVSPVSLQPGWGIGNSEFF